MRDYLTKLLKSGILNQEQRIRVLILMSKLKIQCPQCGAAELSFCHHPKEEAAKNIKSA